VKRRIFNAIVVLSALLCVATAVLWVRSLWIEDSVQWEDATSAKIVSSQHGAVAYFVRWNTRITSPRSARYQSAPVTPLASVRHNPVSGERTYFFCLVA
jgi:hypothetical protein